MSIIFRFCASIFIDKFQSAVSVNAFITLSGAWPNNDNIPINIPRNGIIKISASHGQFSALLNIIFAYTSNTWNLYKIIIKVSYCIFYYYWINLLEWNFPLQMKNFSRTKRLSLCPLRGINFIALNIEIHWYNLLYKFKFL